MNEGAGKAHTVSAQTSALEVQIYDYAGLSPAALHQFIARTQEILVSSGVSVEVDDCEGGTQQLMIDAQRQQRHGIHCHCRGCAG
jgi:hypothetical protein